MLAHKSQSKMIIEDEQYTCDLQPISGNVLYCCKELMNFQSVYKRMYDIVVSALTSILHFYSLLTLWYFFFTFQIFFVSTLHENCFFLSQIFPSWMQVEIGFDQPPDGPSLTDLVATLLGNVFKTLLKKAEYFDPVGKTKISRSLVSLLFAKYNPWFYNS